MTKKAQYIQFYLLVVWAIFLVFVMLVTAVFMKGFVKKEVDIRDAEARVFANRLLYSQSGVAFIDQDLGRVYPGTVEISRIDRETLERSIYIEDNQIIAAAVRLRDSDGKLLREAVYNDIWYYRWLPFIGKGGSGGAGEIVEERYVTIYENGLVKGSGTLEIQMVIPNA